MQRLAPHLLLAVTMSVPVSGGPIIDNFNDGVLSPSWRVVKRSGGASWHESDGTLNIGGSSGQVGELVLQYDQPLADVGLVRIDYDWISCDDHKARVGLGLYDSFDGVDLATGNGFLIKGVKHASNCSQHAVDGNHHVVGTGGTYHIVEPVPTTGAFMIDRNGNSFRIRYLNGRVWEDLFETSHDFAGTPVYPYLFTSNSHSNPSWSVALDNFTADIVPVIRELLPGDANQDWTFDQADIGQVFLANKYRTGASATWGEGDWDGAPGGSGGKPPAGDGVFDQRDVIAALTPSHYLTGPYASIQPNGQQPDNQTSLVYDATTGGLSVDAPVGTELTSLSVESASGIFTAETAQNLGGSFDIDSDERIFKATFGGSFGSLSFGNVAQPGLSEGYLLGDLAAFGSVAGGGTLGEVDLIYVPEPSTIVLSLVAVTAVCGLLRKLRPMSPNTQ